MSKEFELYKLYRNEIIECYKLHRQAFQHYLTFIVAILGATIAGFVKLEENWVSITLLCGPILSFFICKQAIVMCDRAYQGALERVPIILKLEEVLKIKKLDDLSKTKLSVFTRDKYLLPERWVESSTNFEQANDFVEYNLKRGVNGTMRFTFKAVVYLNIVLAVMILGNMFLNYLFIK